MKENGSPAPEFETDDDRSYYLIRLPVHLGAALGTSEKTSGKTSGKTPVDILSLMRENPQVTIPEIAEVVGKTARAIEMQIARLKAEDLLERVGPAKGGYWVVKEQA